MLLRSQHANHMQLPNCYIVLSMQTTCSCQNVTFLGHTNLLQLIQSLNSCQAAVLMQLLHNAIAAFKLQEKVSHIAHLDMTVSASCSPTLSLPFGSWHFFMPDRS